MARSLEKISAFRQQMENEAVEKARQLGIDTGDAVRAMYVVWQSMRDAWFASQDREHARKMQEVRAAMAAGKEF